MTEPGRAATRLRELASIARTERMYGNYGSRPEGYVLLMADAVERLAAAVEAAEAVNLAINTYGKTNDENGALTDALEALNA